MFENIIYTSDFLNYDVEIIKKHVDNPYFETFFLRRESIAIFQQIKNYRVFCRTVKLDEAYVSVLEQMSDSVRNLQLLDDFIEALIKDDTNRKSASNAILIWLSLIHI